MNADSVYNALRYEMTQTKVSIRQLLIGEIAGYGFLVSAMISIGSVQPNADTNSFVAIIVIVLSSLIDMLLYTTTRIVVRWHGEMLRQASYIFVAFELPALENAAGEDHARLWILANRSEALCHGDHKSKGFRARTEIPGDLAPLIQRQIGFGAVATLLALLMLVLRFQQEPEHHVVIQALILPVIFGLCTLFGLRRELKRIRYALSEFTMDWAAYLRERKTNDDRLLQTYQMTCSPKKAPETGGEF